MNHTLLSRMNERPTALNHQIHSTQIIHPVINQPIAYKKGGLTQHNTQRPYTKTGGRFSLSQSVGVSFTNPRPYDRKRCDRLDEQAGRQQRCWPISQFTIGASSHILLIAPKQHKKRGGRGKKKRNRRCIHSHIPYRTERRRSEVCRRHHRRPTTTTRAAR